MKSAQLQALAVVTLVLTALLAGSTRAAPATAAGPTSSSNVALIPGMHAPKYSPTESLPGFPASQLAGYSFGEVPLGTVTPAKLAAYDTVVLYGLRWSDLAGSEQAAVNDFAKTGKVIIWDADSTGGQDYGSFVHPFTTKSSGATGGNRGAVVTFPSSSPLASSDAGSAAYLDPKALVASTHLIGHMNVLVPANGDWSPGLIAANSKIPEGGWVVAWGYGSTGDHSGMVVYSGIDADAFSDDATPNYAVKELAIQLGASFNRSADSSCAPNCSSPPPPPASGGGGSGSGSGGGTGGSGGSGGSTGGGGSTGIGAPQSPTYAQCSFARRPPTSWVRGIISLSLRTSVANGIHGTVTTSKNKVVARGTASSPGVLSLKVDTRLLPSNRVSPLKANVFVNTASACSLTTSLRVDNAKPRALAVKTTRTARGNLVAFRANEPLRVQLVTRHHRYAAHTVKRAGKVSLRFPKTVTNGTLVLRDRAGNSARLPIAWR